MSNKHDIHQLLTILISFIAALGVLTACSNDDNTVSASQAPVYSVNISATICGETQTRAVTFGTDGGTVTSTFAEGDKVYVYNETRGAFACNASGTAIPLTLAATDISADGKHCTLSGELTFHKWVNKAWTPVTDISSTDTYSLFYQMNDCNPKYPGDSQFYYFDEYGTDLNGSASQTSNFDFAEVRNVSLTLSGSSLSASGSVKFQNVQSMFRQRLTFADNNGNALATQPTITKLTIRSKNRTLVNYYKPLDGDDTYETDYDLVINNPDIDANGDIYLALSFHYADDAAKNGDQLILIAEANDGRKFTCTKDAPSSGFVNGKYYYGSMTPTPLYDVTVTDVNTGEILSPTGYIYYLSSDKIYNVSGSGNYSIQGYDNSSNIKVIIADGTRLSTIANIGEIVLEGNVTVTGPIMRSHYYFYTLISGSGMLTFNGTIAVGQWRIDPDQVCLRIIITSSSKFPEGSFGSVKTEDGTSDVSYVENDGYRVYGHSSGGGPGDPPEHL